MENLYGLQNSFQSIYLKYCNWPNALPYFLPIKIWKNSLNWFTPHHFRTQYDYRCQKYFDYCSVSPLSDAFLSCCRKYFTVVISRTFATFPFANNTTVNTLRRRQNDRHFPDDILKWIFLFENVWISIKISYWSLCLSVQLTIFWY